MIGSKQAMVFQPGDGCPFKKKIYFSYNRTVLIRSFHLTMCHQDRKGLNGFISRSRSASTDFLMDFMLPKVFPVGRQLSSYKFSPAGKEFI